MSEACHHDAARGDSTLESSIECNLLHHCCNFKRSIHLEIYNFRLNPRSDFNKVNE